MSDNEECEYEQLCNSGKIESYIVQLEHLISKRANMYGYDDLTVIKQNEKLCKLLNQYAIQQLNKQNYEKCINYLKKAELTAVYAPEWKVQTYNNLACYYRKLGKSRTALNYLQQALQIELQQNTSQQLPDTYLNLCAVLSQLDRHDEALQHIYLSIIMLQHELLLSFLGKNEIKTIDSNLPSRQSSQQQAFSSRTTLSEKFTRKKQEKISVLIVAYHNLGVEMEHLKKSLESQKIFNTALQLAESVLPPNHQMLATLQNIIKKVDIQEPFNLRPQLPRVGKKNSHLKSVYNSVSPQTHELLLLHKKKENIQLPVNMQRTCKSQAKSIPDYRPKLHSLHQTECLKNETQTYDISKNKTKPTELQSLEY